MKIKLVRFPYKEYEAGDVCDFGIEKNKSLVALGRAVWFDPNRIKKQDPVEKVVKEAVELVVGEKEEETKEPEPKKKDSHHIKGRVLENEVREKIIEETKDKPKGFWDSLK